MRATGKRIAIGTGIVAVLVLGIAAPIGWPHIRFAWLFESLGPNAQGFPEYRHRQTGIVMVRLPGGTFWMGAQKDDPEGRNFDSHARPGETPVHEVALSPFMIGKYEVTQAQWKAAMGWNRSKFLGDDRPVENVSSSDIDAFEAKTGLRLPTEAQWESACRAGSPTTISGTGKIDDMGWYFGNSGDATHPVGTKAPNGYGLHDVHGNVWEMCEDVYDRDFYGKLEASELDPVSRSGSGSGDRIVRGGNWDLARFHCHSSTRGTGTHCGLRAAFYPLP